MQLEQSGTRETERTRSSTRELVWTLALAALGWIGAAPLGARGSGDPLLVLVWAALAAPVAGAIAARASLGPWPWGLAAPSAWVLALVWTGASSPRDVPTPLWAAGAWMGLFALGAAASELLGKRDVRAPYVAALISLALNCAAWAPGKLGAPWSAETTALLIDLSPVALVAECAGLDWMRVEWLYEAAQTDRFERAAWRGELAGPTCLLVGYAAWAFARFVGRAPRPG